MTYQCGESLPQRGAGSWYFPAETKNGPQGGSRLNCQILTGLFFGDEAPWAEPEHQQEDQTHRQKTHMRSRVDQV